MKTIIISFFIIIICSIISCNKINKNQTIQIKHKINYSLIIDTVTIKDYQNVINGKFNAIYDSTHFITKRDGKLLFHINDGKIVALFQL